MYAHTQIPAFFAPSIPPPINEIVPRLPRDSVSLFTKPNKSFKTLTPEVNVSEFKMLLTVSVQVLESLFKEP